MMEENKEFLGKTLDEAINNAMCALALPREELEITVLEEGKKKLFGSTKWKITAKEKKSDGARAAEFIDGLLKILGVEAECEVESAEDCIKLDIKTENSARVIGKRGDVLDAIQCMAGAVANIGREKYIKVVVDCENYRSQREEALVALAAKVAQKAVETGRKVTLEPMNPYERRIIHSALLNSEEVKTSSEGREPSRYVVIIPNNLKQGERPLRYGERNDKRGRRDDRRDRSARSEKRGDRRERGRRRDDRNSKPAGGAKRGKKEIYFGTYLGNSGVKDAPVEGQNPEENKED